MKILVTGAGGFVGDAICRELFTQSHDVIACATARGIRHGLQARCITYTPLAPPWLPALLLKEQPDWVVHCAGSASVASSLADRNKDFLSSVGLTKVLYDAIHQSSPRSRVIFTSSAAVYGSPEILPISEQSPCNPISPYGEHKLQCEQLGEQLARRCGSQVVNLRVFSAYGPGLTKQVLWDIYSKSRVNREVVLGGDGTETRDFIYANDLARVVAKIIQHPQGIGSVLNVSSGSSVTIRELATKLLSKLSFDGTLRFSGNDCVGSPKYWSSNSNTLARLNIANPTSLDHGLTLYASWLRQNEGADNSRSILARAG